MMFDAFLLATLGLFFACGVWVGMAVQVCRNRAKVDQSRHDTHFETGTWTFTPPSPHANSETKVKVTKRTNATKCKTPAPALPDFVVVSRAGSSYHLCESRRSVKGKSGLRKLTLCLHCVNGMDDCE